MFVAIEDCEMNCYLVAYANMKQHSYIVKVFFKTFLLRFLLLFTIKAIKTTFVVFSLYLLVVQVLLSFLNIEGNEEIIHSLFKFKINVIYCKEFRKGTLEKCLKIEKSQSSYLKKAIGAKKCVFQRKDEARVFLSFNIIISHVFPENFIEISQFVQKIPRFSSSILTIFINFSDFFIFPCHKEINDASI